MNKIDSDELDRVVCEALRELQPAESEAIAVDGKTVRSTRPDTEHENKLNLFTALAHAVAIVQNQVGIDDKSNEIPALPELLEPLELDGVVVTADALNTQRESGDTGASKTNCIFRATPPIGKITAESANTMEPARWPP